MFISSILCHPEQASLNLLRNLTSYIFCEDAQLISLVFEDTFSVIQPTAFALVEQIHVIIYYLNIDDNKVKKEMLVSAYYAFSNQ